MAGNRSYIPNLRSNNTAANADILWKRYTEEKGEGKDVLSDEVKQIQSSIKLPNYPKPPAKGGVSEIMFGVKVDDPWRSLEMMKDEETKRFIDEQNKCSFPFLNSDIRKPLERRCKDLFHFTKTSCPMLQGDGYYYWLFNSGNDSRDCILRSRSLEKMFGSENPHVTELFFDPTCFSSNTSLYDFSWSPSGKYFAAILQKSGSDWQTIKVMDTQSLIFLDDILIQTKFNFGVCWIEDFGFIYKKVIDRIDPWGKQDNADGQFALYYHFLYTKQQDDFLIWKGEGKEERSLFAEKPYFCDNKESKRKWLFFTIYRNTNPECEAFMVEITHLFSKGTFDSHQLSDLSQKRWIARGFEGNVSYVGTLSNGKHLFLSTTNNCNRGRVISIDEQSLDSTKSEGQVPFEVIVAETNYSYVLEKVNLVRKDLLVLIYLHDVCPYMIFIKATTGKYVGWSNLDNDFLEHNSFRATLPKCSSINSIVTRADCNEFYLSIATWTQPAYIIKGTYYPEQDKVNLERLTKSKDRKHDEDEIVCKQIFYRSHDGIQIPMYLCHFASLQRNVSHKALLHAYGGFSTPLLPHYDPFFIAFIREMKGIVAIAGIRGGGEYGKGWHEQGMGKNRLNSFQDFAFAAKYLHKTGLSKPSLTSIYGSSNGGTLIMANINRNPELFGACMADAGIADLIRFPLFTMGRIWQAEYGSPYDPEMFPFLFEISPLHNIVHSKGLLPAIFITHGDHDNRVNLGANSLKYLAEIQTRKKDNPKPFLGKIYPNSGHEEGSKSTKQKMEEALDRLVFCLTFLK